MAVEVGASLPVLQKTASVQPQHSNRRSGSAFSDRQVHNVKMERPFPGPPFGLPFPILDGHSAGHAPASK